MGATSKPSGKGKTGYPGQKNKSPNHGKRKPIISSIITEDEVLFVRKLLDTGSMDETEKALGLCKNRGYAILKRTHVLKFMEDVKNKAREDIVESEADRLVKMRTQADKVLNSILGKNPDDPMFLVVAHRFLELAYKRTNAFPAAGVNGANMQQINAQTVQVYQSRWMRPKDEQKELPAPEPLTIEGDNQ